VIHWNILRNDRRLFVQMKVRDLETGRVTELKEHGDTKYEVLDSEEVELTYSYRDGVDEVFFDPNGNEVRCGHEFAADALKWACDGYVGFFVAGRLAEVRTPSSVVATVKETAPPMKGGGSGLKDAVLDNGIKVRVGLNVGVGDRVRLDPETLEFKERA
jgi:translation elongation factor P/translation initiation factor 5A